jgi:hypothetical protein
MRGRSALTTLSVRAVKEKPEKYRGVSPHDQSQQLPRRQAKFQNPSVGLPASPNTLLGSSHSLPRHFSPCQARTCRGLESHETHETSIAYSRACRLLHKGPKYVYLGPADHPVCVISEYTHYNCSSSSRTSKMKETMRDASDSSGEPSCPLFGQMNCSLGRCFNTLTNSETCIGPRRADSHERTCSGPHKLL